jgi:hypothetical protein
MEKKKQKKILDGRRSIWAELETIGREYSGQEKYNVRVKKNSVNQNQLIPTLMPPASSASPSFSLSLSPFYSSPLFYINCIQ